MWGRPQIKFPVRDSVPGDHGDCRQGWSRQAFLAEYYGHGVSYFGGRETRSCHPVFGIDWVVRPHSTVYSSCSHSPSSISALSFTTRTLVTPHSEYLYVVLHDEYYNFENYCDDLI